MQTKDWPTSVLCGIMRLSLPQILLGTLPVYFLVTPTCLTGALLYMSSLETETGNPEFPWAGTVSAITTSLTALVSFGSLIVAAYYLEQAAGKNAPALEAIPDDLEVKEADEKDAQLKKCYHDVTQWDLVPILAKQLLHMALVCIITSSYMVMIVPNLCFVPHSLTDSIDENLGGNALNLFLPLGWVVIGLFGTSIILIYLFQSWGKVSFIVHFRDLVRPCSSLFIIIYLCSEKQAGLPVRAKLQHLRGKLYLKTPPLLNPS